MPKMMVPSMDAGERSEWYALAGKVEGLRMIIRGPAEMWKRPERADIDAAIAHIQEESNRLLMDKDGDDDVDGNTHSEGG